MGMHHPDWLHSLILRCPPKALHWRFCWPPWVLVAPSAGQVLWKEVRALVTLWREYWDSSPGHGVSSLLCCYTLLSSSTLRRQTSNPGPLAQTKLFLSWFFQVFPYSDGHLKHTWHAAELNEYWLHSRKVRNRTTTTTTKNEWNRSLSYLTWKSFCWDIKRNSFFKYFAWHQSLYSPACLLS